MKAFQNLQNIKLHSLLQISSVSPISQELEVCQVGDLCIVLDKDYLIKDSVKVKNLRTGKEVWLDKSDEFNQISYADDVRI